MPDSDQPTPVLRNRDGLPPAVLLVEDETLVALMLRHVLEDLGCQVVGWATTADEAERLAARTPPDLILMDIRLKGQRDGIAAAAVLQRRYRVPIVFVTALNDRETLARARRLAPAGVLLKPFAPEVLKEVLVRACR